MILAGGQAPDDVPTATLRQVVSALSLCGLFLAVYLTLYHYGYVGQLTCGTGGCETVQASKWARLLGYPVALWGAGYYASVFAVSTLGSFGGFAAQRWPSAVLVAVNGWGVAFSSWLTWLEIGVIQAICRYCVVSALVVVALFVVSLLDWRARRHRPVA